MKTERTYILTHPVRGTQTCLVKATSAKEARAKWEADDDSIERVDLSVDWAGVPRIVVDGGWKNHKGGKK